MVKNGANLSINSTQFLIFKPSILYNNLVRLSVYKLLFNAGKKKILFLTKKKKKKKKICLLQLLLMFSFYIIFLFFKI